MAAILGKFCFATLFLLLALSGSISAGEGRKDSSVAGVETIPATNVLFLNIEESLWPWTYSVSAACRIHLEEVTGHSVMMQVETPRADLSSGLVIPADGIDLVVAWDPQNRLPALLHRLPEVPVVSLTIDLFTVSADAAPAERLHVISLETNALESVEAVHACLPDTRRLVVVSGSEEIGGLLIECILDEVGERYQGMDIVFWTGLPLAELEEQVAALPDDHAVLFLTMARDRNGVVYVGREVVHTISTASAVPVFGVASTYLDRGVVGGYVVSAEKVGRRAARAAIRAAGLEAPDTGPVSNDCYEYRFDWRQLKRWGISEARLPQGSVLLNRPASFFDRHPVLMHAAAIGAWLLMAALLGLFLHQRQRSRLLKRLLRQEQLEHEARDDYAAVLAATGDAVIVADLQGIVRTFNSGAQKLFGYLRAEAEGMSIRSLCPPDQVEHQDELVRQVVESGIVQGYEAHCLTRDGHQVIAEMTVMLRRDDQGRAVGVLAVARDITERKRSEDDLLSARDEAEQQSVTFDALNRLFRGAIACETSADVAQVCLSVARDVIGCQYGSVAEINAEERFDSLAFSDTGWDECRMAQLDPSSLQGMEVRGIWRTALESEHGLIINDPAGHPDGVGLPEGHPPLDSFLGVPFKHRQFRGMIGVANKEGGFTETDREIIEALALAFAEVINSKRNEEFLRSSEDKYRKLFDNVVVGVGIANVEGRVFEINHAMSQLTGYDAEDMASIDLADTYVDPGDRAPFIERLQRDGLVEDYVVQLKRKDGSHFWASLSSRPIFHEGQEAYLTTMLDVTGRKLEEQRREALLELASIFSGGETLEEIYQGVAELLHQRLGYPATAVELYDRDAAEMAYVGVVGIRLPSDVILRVPIEQTISGLVATTGEALLERDASSRTEYRYESLRAVNARTFICVPVHSAGSVLGTVSVADTEERQDARQTLELMRIIADQLTREFERRYAEEELRKAERRFELFMEHTPAVVFIKDEAGHLVYVNKHWEKVVGCTDWQGKSAHDLFPPEAAEAMDADDGLAMEHGFHMLQETVPTLDGSLRTFESLKFRIDRPDEPPLLGGISVDISERKRAEEEIRRFKTIFDHANYGSALTDTQGNIEYVNAHFARAHGYEPEELVGKHLSVFHSEGQIPGVQEINEGLLATGAFGPLEVGHAHRDGSEFPMLMTGSVLHDAEGRPTHLAATALDITDRKRADEERGQLERQYHQAQKMESVGRLAGGVAHDLNNLLSPILGYSEMLLDGLASGDSRRESVDEIHKAGLRSRDLVRQLLAFSRTQTLEYKPVDLNRAVEGFKKLLQRTIRENIAIETSLSPRIAPVLADIGQIEQVILNLAVNASDAMPEGGRLVIRTEPVSLSPDQAARHQDLEPGPHIVLSVSDSGCGMDEETLELLFEPFFSTKGELGTGLGLATVYGIVKQHGGDITVDSVPGQGAMFRIYMPAALNERVPDEAGTAPVPAPTGTETILLAEDDASLRRLVVAALQRQGYTVLVARDGDHALSLARAHEGPIHLLLTDVVMPTMNGVELYDQALGIMPDLRVLYMSGYTDKVVSREGILEESGTFIQKPFTVRALAGKLREVLARG